MRTRVVFVGAVLAVAALVWLQRPGIQAQSQAAAGVSMVSSWSETGGRAMAPHIWTREEMESAVPYPMPVAEPGASLEPLAVGNGQPGADAGGGIGGIAGTAQGVPALFVEPSAAVGPRGYGFPAPHTFFQELRSYLDYPLRTVGKVFFSTNQGSFVCSGSSIGGDGAFTAGHCVHGGRGQPFHRNWSFIPALRDFVNPHGQWTANHLWVSGAWAASTDLRFDTGGAVVNRINFVSASQPRVIRRLSERVGFLGFAWNWPVEAQSSHWYETGYPAQAQPGFTPTGRRQWVALASFAYFAPGFGAPAPIGTGSRNTGGSSGGPWIRNFAPLVAGAVNHLNGVNSFTRLFPNGTRLQEMFSPYFNNSTKLLKDCIVNSVPGNPADPNKGCAPGT